MDEGGRGRSNEERLGFISHVFGDNMVLQRAPARAVVWGFSKTAGSTITLFFDGTSYTAKAGKDGTWRVTLPPREASTAHNYNISVSSSAGESQTLHGVVFGEV